METLTDWDWEMLIASETDFETGWELLPDSKMLTDCEMEFEILAD